MSLIIRISRLIKAVFVFLEDLSFGFVQQLGAIDISSFNSALFMGAVAFDSFNSCLQRGCIYSQFVQ